MGYNGYTEKRKASNEKYLAKFERVTVRVTPEEKKEITRKAQEAGKSVQRYVIDCALRGEANV